MIMQTLEELKNDAEAAKDEYLRQKESAQRPIVERRATLEQAEEDMQAALASGNKSAYFKAKRVVEFERAMLTKLETTIDDPVPLYADEQYEMYRRHIILAYNTEVKPLYEQLQAILDSGIRIVEQIEAKTKLNNAVVSGFNATIPASDGWRKANSIAGATSNGVPGNIKNVFRKDSSVQNSLSFSLRTCERMINAN